MATTISRKTNHFRYFYRSFSYHTLNRCPYPLPSSQLNEALLHYPRSLSLLPQSVRIPFCNFPFVLLFLLIPCIALENLRHNCLNFSSLKFLWFWKIFRYWLEGLEHNLWLCIRDACFRRQRLQLMWVQEMKLQKHKKKLILVKKKSLGNQIRAVVLGNPSEEGYIFMLPCCLHELNCLSLKKVTFLNLSCWPILQPVSWLSFLLLVATGVGIIFYYDKQKRKHIEGRLLWWVGSLLDLIVELGLMSSLKIFWTCCLATFSNEVLP